MRFDLYVWHERTPITALDAAAKVAAWENGYSGVFASHVSVSLLRAELLARFPSGAPAAERNTPTPCTPRYTTVSTGTNCDGMPRDGADAYVWRIWPAPSASVLALSVAAPFVGLVADAARHGAKRHGLVCYDPREQLVDPNAPGPEPAFTLSSARMAPVADPDDALVERTVRRLSVDNFFVVLERADGWFVQVGYGHRAGAAAGTYALEYQEGSPERHFRCATTDPAQALRLVRAFHAGDGDWRGSHAWQPLQW